MNKLELADIVDQAYATFNAALPQEELREKAVYRAWYDVLHDVEYQEAKRAILDLAVKTVFLPKPGDVRRSAINSRIGMTQFDDPYVAWGKLLTISHEINSGQFPTLKISEALSITLKNLGPGAYGLHTNGDRDMFIRVYDHVVQELSATHYQIPDNKDCP
jgi:hypothetical protein